MHPLYHPSSTCLQIMTALTHALHLDKPAAADAAADAAAVNATALAAKAEASMLLDEAGSIASINLRNIPSWDAVVRGCGTKAENASRSFTAWH